MSHVRWINLIPYPTRTHYQTGFHYVYLIYAKGEDLYKIGWTANVRERMTNLRHDTDISGPLRLVHVIDTDCGQYLERQLHLIFRHRNSRRELFRLTNMDVEWIVNLGSSLPDGIPLSADVVPPLAEWETDSKIWRDGQSI